MLDDFALNYAKKIWPAISQKTQYVSDYGDSDVFIIMGCSGVETVDLIPCNEAEFAKWGYAPRHDTLILIFAESPFIKRIAKHNPSGWSAVEE